MTVHLSERDPRVPADRLLADLVPPPRFAEVSFDTYRPDPGQPSQAEAVERLRAFAATVGEKPRKRLLGKARPVPGVGGVYLDGGYGVGKTHLLASLWHAAPGPKLFATFVELTHLVGALGFHDAVDALSTYALVCVDEFELDDPGDTVLVSTLLTRLREAGVRLAATSNTLPGRLGEGRFATDDFLREIQGLAAAFESVRIDGEDYRHRGLPQAPTPPDLDAVKRAAQADDASLDHFVDLSRHLVVGPPLEVRRPARRGAHRLPGGRAHRRRPGRRAAARGARRPALRPRPAGGRQRRALRPAVRGAAAGRAATARSTSARSAGWWRWPARAPRRPDRSGILPPMTSSFLETLAVPTGPVDLAAYDPRGRPGFDGKKAEGKAALYALGEELSDLQERLFAEGLSGGQRRILLVLQGMDTSGKGGILRHAVGLVDPQGVHIKSFKAPTRGRASSRLPVAGREGAARGRA